MKMNAYKDIHILLVCLSFKNHSLIKCDVYNPFLFVLIISPYRLIISAAFSCSCIFSFMIIKSNNYFFISSFDRRYAFLLYATPFHIYKQKIITLAPGLKPKCLSRLIFFLKFRSKKITSSPVILSFSHSSFKVLSINPFISKNALLTTLNTAKAILTRVLSILITCLCS